MAKLWRYFATLWIAMAFGWVDSLPSGTGASSFVIPNSETFTYQGLQYIIFYNTVTWDEAAAICAAYHATLATADTKQRAVVVADALAESNRRLFDAWLGARSFQNHWIWVSTSNLIVKYGDEAIPWIYYPREQSVGCMAIDAKSHRGPRFTAANCTQPKPFVCERSIDIDNDKPKQMRVVRSGNSVFSLFHGRLDWYKALAYCRNLGRRLAVIKDGKDIYEISKAMTKARPDFETVWIGGKYSYGNWRWASTGEKIPDKESSISRFPQWRKKNTTKAIHGCILLDRYQCDLAMFTDTLCDRTRDFICEEYTQAAADEPDRYLYGDKMYEMVLDDVTWEEAEAVCKEKGGRLTHVRDADTMGFLIDLMEISGPEVRHAWIGGQVVNGSWEWTGTNKPIYPQPNHGSIGGVMDGIDSEKYFPPWCDSEVHYDMPCLNLDRTEHTQPAFYGLECNNTQPAICRVDCLDPMKVTNGQWICTPALTEDMRTCLITCNKGYKVYGGNIFKCSIDGWVDQAGQSFAPECMSIEDYANLLVDRIHLLIESNYIGSILFLVEDSTNMTHQALQGFLSIVLSLVKVFPLNSSLKGGVTIYGDRVLELLSLDTDASCHFLKELPRALFSSVTGNPDLELAMKSAVKQMEKAEQEPNRRRLVVVLAASDKATPTTEDISRQMREAGHILYLLAVNDLVRFKLSSHMFKMASKGPDDPPNNIVFDSAEELKQFSHFIKKGRTVDVDLWPCGYNTDEGYTGGYNTDEGYTDTTYNIGTDYVTPSGETDGLTGTTVDGPTSTTSYETDDSATSEADGPTSTEVDGPTSTEADDSATSETDGLTSTEADDSTSSETDGPATSEADDSTSSETDGPTSTEVDGPTTSEADDSATSETDGPTTSAEDTTTSEDTGTKEDTTPKKPKNKKRIWGKR